MERNMTRGVRVNAAIYTEIGKVHAEDSDAEADVITYHLENVTFHRPKTGMKRVNTFINISVSKSFISILGAW